jgi:hypothetical protein
LDKTTTPPRPAAAPAASASGKSGLSRQQRRTAVRPELAPPGWRSLASGEAVRARQPGNGVVAECLDLVLDRLRQRSRAAQQVDRLVHGQNPLDLGSHPAVQLSRRLINNGPADAATRGTPASASGNRSERASTTASAPEGASPNRTAMRRSPWRPDRDSGLGIRHRWTVLRHGRSGTEPDRAQLVVKQLTRAFGRAECWQAKISTARPPLVSGGAPLRSCTDRNCLRLSSPPPGTRIVSRVLRCSRSSPGSPKRDLPTTQQLMG